MDKEIKIELKGFDQAIRNFESLDKAIRDDIVNFCAEEALKAELIPQYRTALPYSSKTMSSINVFPIETEDDPISYFGGPGSKGFHIRFADRGTKVRTTKLGYNRGFILGANRVPKIVFDAVPKIVDNFSKVFIAQVEDEVKKM